MVVHKSLDELKQGGTERNNPVQPERMASPLLMGAKKKKKKAAGLTLVCPSVTVRGTLVEGHLFLGGKGLSQFHKTTIWTGKAQGNSWRHPDFNFFFFF